MKKTIKEVYELIKEKRGNAISSLGGALTSEEKAELKGEIDAYYDVLLLIENGGLLEQ